MECVKAQHAHDSVESPACPSLYFLLSVIIEIDKSCERDTHIAGTEEFLKAIFIH